MRFSFYFIFLLFSITSCTNIFDHDEDISIQHQHPDVEDITLPPLKIVPTDEQLDSKKVDIDSLPLMDWKSVTIKDFWFEIIMMAFMGVYVLAYTSGKAKNKSIARAWLKCHLDTWKDNFSHVGDDKGFKLTEDGPRDYIMYGSGRLYCKYIYGMIHLAPRHDLIQWAIEYFSGKNMQDEVTFNVTLNDEESDGIVLAILPRLKAVAIAKERWDLDNFAKPKSFPEFPKDDYVLLSDSGEFAAAFWGLESVKKALWGSIMAENGKRHSKIIIEQITLSDLPQTEPEDLDVFSATKKRLQFVFSIPDLENATTDVTEYQKLLSDMVFDVVDLIGTAGKLSIEAKTKSKKLRVAAESVVIKKNEEKRRQELAEKKYSEKIAKEKAIINLSPEAQRKAEEKLRKQEAKKSIKNRIKRI